MDECAAAVNYDAGTPDWDLCSPCAAAAVTLAVDDAEPRPDPAAFIRHLRAAQGYLELNLPLEAWIELEDIEPPQRCAEVPVLGLRVAIYQALERWEPMAELCRHLDVVQPGEVCWSLWLAYATRRAEGIPAARDILLRAMVRFPAEAVISFNLACYAAQSGDLDDARDCLSRAFRLDAGLREKALDDPDLAPLWPPLPWP